MKRAVRDGGVRTHFVDGATEMRCVCGRCSLDTSMGLVLLATLCGPFTSQRRLTLLSGSQ